MKLILLSLITVATLCCSSNLEKSYSEKEIITFTKYPPSISTLDSLQGTWISNNDSSYKIKIANDTMFHFSLNVLVDTTKLFLSDIFTEDSLTVVALAGKKDGEYLIQNELGYNHFSCYIIGYISNKDLVLRYRGKELSFSR